MRRVLIIAAVTLTAAGSWGQEAAPAPDVNQVIEQMAAVGPEALLARVKELKSAEQGLVKQAGDLRAQADQKDKEAEALRARIAAVEKFTAALAAAMAPPPLPELAKEAKAEPAPAPAEAAPAPPPAEAAAPPAEQPAPPAEAAPASNDMNAPQQ